jgi:hypothetical protein
LSSTGATGLTAGVISLATASLGNPLTRGLKFGWRKISARLGGLLMRNHDNIDSELRLITARRRRARDLHGPRPVDASLDELVDEPLEEQECSVTRLETRRESTDLGPLCW